MTGFEQLHPAVKHHVVNSLGWNSLRPLQDEAEAPVLAGEHALLLAPIAGGKTEAAAFPVFSRMLSEDWHGLSVLYLCPIKTLLNNLEVRLHQYAGYVGRRVGVWHGDVSSTAHKRLVREPPDLLLTTPESVEVMLASARVDHSQLLGNVRTIIVDELHAFAGDDRGWHLLALTEQLCRVNGCDIQRLGLSATVGNPDELLAWFRGGSSGPGQVVAPALVAGAGAGAEEPDVTLDYVASVDNAATVISRLHRGEKRLVFCDSRARVERLANALRGHSVPTFVSHSSLSASERQRAEEAFATRRTAQVEPSPIAGRSQWLGSAGHLRGELCRAVRDVLAGDDVGVRLTKRGDEALGDARDEFGWADAAKTALVGESDGSQRWWTFAGKRANLMLRESLRDLRSEVSCDDNFAIGVSSHVTAEELASRIAGDETSRVEMPIDDEVVDGLKFSQCLPRVLAEQELRARQLDAPGVQQCARELIRTVSISD